MSEYIKKENAIREIQDEIDLIGGDSEQDEETVALVKATFVVAQNAIRNLPAENVREVADE